MVKYKTDKKLIWRKIEDKIFIIDTEKEKMHSLNSSAAFIWNMIIKGKTPDEILILMDREFDIEDKNILKKDIEEIILKFKDEGLIYEKEKKV